MNVNNNCKHVDECKVEGAVPKLRFVEVILALVFVGIYFSLSSSESSIESAAQIVEDVELIHKDIKQMFVPQGNYGTAGTSLNDVLVTTKRVPVHLSVDTSTSPYTLSRQSGGKVNIVSTGSGFSLTETDVPRDACVWMLATAQPWTSVKAGSAMTRPGASLPIALKDALKDCATGTTMVFYENS